MLDNEYPAVCRGAAPNRAQDLNALLVAPIVQNHLQAIDNGFDRDIDTTSGRSNTVPSSRRDASARNRR
jgi:hypothetical protein